MRPAHLSISGTFLFLILTCCSIYVYLAVQEFSCKGCIFMPSIQQAEADGTLIAIYSSESTEQPDTIFMTRGIIHKGSYQQFTDKYFPVFTKVPVIQNGKLKSLQTINSPTDYGLATLRNGSISGYNETAVVPSVLFLTDSSDVVIKQYYLREKRISAIKVKPGRKYLRELKMVLSTY